MPIELDEMELLAFIRIGKFEKIEITFNSGKMDVIEGTKRGDANSILSNVIHEHDSWVTCGARV